MARILFVVNEHANEPFAIPVARETAKLLRAKGHTVFVRKTPKNVTSLGILLGAEKMKLGMAHSLSHDKLDAQLDNFERETRPNIVYSFHCTPSDSPHWKNLGMKTEHDWDIGRYPRSKEGICYRTVELKAIYKDLPPKLRKKLGKISGGETKEKTKYFSRTASVPESIKQRLIPGKFARQISKVMAEKDIPLMEKLFFSRGRITLKRIKSKTRRNRG